MREAVAEQIADALEQQNTTAPIAVAARPVVEAVVADLVATDAFQGVFHAGVRELHSAIVEGRRSRLLVRVDDAAQIVKDGLATVNPRRRRVDPRNAPSSSPWGSRRARRSTRPCGCRRSPAGWRCRWRSARWRASPPPCDAPPTGDGRSRRSGSPSSPPASSTSPCCRSASTWPRASVSDTRQRTALRAVFWSVTHLLNVQAKVVITIGTVLAIAAAYAGTGQIRTRLGALARRRALAPRPTAVAGHRLPRRDRRRVLRHALARGDDRDHDPRRGVRRVRRRGDRAARRARLRRLGPRRLGPGPADRPTAGHRGDRGDRRGQRDDAVRRAGLRPGPAGPRRPTRPGTWRRGCNGSMELCDRRLDEVVFAGTHNSMAASAEGWVAARQTGGIGAQLDGGVRAFLHRPPLRRAQRRPGAHRLAQRVRHRARSSSSGPRSEALTEGVLAFVGVPEGEREVYLCHIYCELGATGAVDAFRRDPRLPAGEPQRGRSSSCSRTTSTPPTRCDALERGGLARRALEWSTRRARCRRCGEMIERRAQRRRARRERGRRGAVVPAGVRRAAGHAVPVRAAPTTSRAAAGRGTTDSPLLLVNHWLTVDPPNPTVAAEVNAADVLQRHASAVRARTSVAHAEHPGRRLLRPRRPARRRRRAQRRRGDHRRTDGGTDAGRLGRTVATDRATTTLTGWGRTAPSTAEVVVRSSRDTEALRRRRQGPAAAGRHRPGHGPLVRRPGAERRWRGAAASGPRPRRRHRRRRPARPPCRPASASTSCCACSCPAASSCRCRPAPASSRVGGAIASDIHGKNHHVDGSFGANVTRLSLLLADGSIVEASPTERVRAVLGDGRRDGPHRRDPRRHDPPAADRDQSLRRRHRADAGPRARCSRRWTRRDRYYRYSVAWIDPMASGPAPRVAAC